ncbi:MAG: hypothetical protein TYPL_2630 [Candidatus Tyloplasma litorale]|nr:MAG: hypothetical protein TYPL_2630 [Mycoplasmatales bacterium]
MNIDNINTTTETELMQIESTVVSNESEKGEKPQKKKKKLRLSMPSATTILIGVVFFAIFITWIVHFMTVGDYIEGTDAIPIISDGNLSGYYDGGMNWYISEFSKAYPEGDGWIAVVDGTWMMGSGTLDANSIDSNIIESGQEIIDSSWFNFNNSNWYVSSNGMYGIGNAILATIGGVFSAFDLIFFTIAIGVMIDLLMETDVLKGVVNSLIKGLGDKRLLLVPVLFLVFSIWGTVLGTQEATLAMMPIVIPALIVAGFDAATGFMVVLVGCTTGIAASVLEPFALGTLAGEFNKIWQEADGAGSIGIGTGIVLRIVLWIIYTSIGMTFVTWYGHRVMVKGKSFEDEKMIEDNKKWAAEAFGKVESKQMTKPQKLSLVILCFVMAWMVFVLLPWENWFSGLETANWFQTMSHMFFFSSVIGEWSFLQLGFLFVFGWFISAKAFGYSWDQMSNNWKSSWKTFRTVAAILTLSRATSIVLTNSGSAYFLANNLFMQLSDGLSAGALSLCIFPIYVLMACLIPSMSGLAGISAPIIAPIVSGYGTPEAMLPAIVGIMALYPLAQGLVNMTVPTTGLVIAQAEASNTSYARVAPYLFSYAGVIAIVGVIVVGASFTLM